MEKLGVVKEKLTPSIISGKPSDFIKNGNAFCIGEKDNIKPADNRLAKSIEKLYTKRNDTITSSE